MEDYYKRKLKDRQSSLEQAEAELLEADRHARIQLVERRKVHQAEMHALNQWSKEELDRRRTMLEEESTAVIARLKAQLQGELAQQIASMQPEMKRQLDDEQATEVDGACTQVDTHSAKFPVGKLFGCSRMQLWQDHVAHHVFRISVSAGSNS
ncbi:MAG: hypothetical protein HC767_05415 [Akkermansiaceae bacterium]|nr:hypothetical protein [Akkermansiaceae bacterium]